MTDGQRTKIENLTIDQAIEGLREYTHLALDPDQDFDDPEEWLLGVAEAFRVLDDELLIPQGR